MEDSKSKPNIIIDNGSGFSKVGFSGEKEPRAVFPTIVGDEKNNPLNIKLQLNVVWLMIGMKWKKFGIIHLKQN